MSQPRRGSMDRRLELACDRALIGLDPAEEAELASLMGPGERMDPGLELAAAAIAVAEMTLDEPMPRHLAERVLASAPRAGSTPLQVVRGGTVPMLQQPPRAQQPPEPVRAPQPASIGAPPRAPEPAAPITKARRFYQGRAVPWLAAAACFALAVGSFVVRGRPRVDPAVDPALALSPADGRARLLAEAPDVTRVAWTPATDPTGQGASGDVVWSTARQQGFMTFRALAPNDPRKNQYQLWIFDGERDERYPVDGGVFDVDAATGEAVIPIAAKVRVSRPTQFVVTVERPGGVVVSSRERVAVAAKVSG